MYKSIKLAINDFSPIPFTLQDTGSPAKSLKDIAVNLGDVYHHHYLDSWGVEPPDPDPANFDHIRYLLPCSDFRFRTNGLGVSKTFKSNKSNELGHAFCRWFLAEHCGIDYFAHIDDVCGHGFLAAHGSISIEKDPSVKGDAPDYFCSNNANQVFLAEAKGSISSVGLGTKKFASWRRQFNRVKILNSYGAAMSLKGFIVATRWAFESDGSRTFSKIYAEDPKTPGEEEFIEEGAVLSSAIKSVHYARSWSRLRQPLLSAALLRGFTISNELRFQVAFWECLLPTMRRLSFVGGYFPELPDAVQPFAIQDGKYFVQPPDPFRLDRSAGTFVGIEKGIALQLVAGAREGMSAIRALRRLDAPASGTSDVSLFPDGHVIGPIGMFRPTGVGLV